MLAFTAVSSLPSPMDKGNHDDINCKLYVVYKGASDKWMNIEVRKAFKNNCNKDDVIHCGVSVDEFCYHRDFFFLNGVAIATVQGNSKAIDTAS